MNMPTKYSPLLSPPSRERFNDNFPKQNKIEEDNKKRLQLLASSELEKIKNASSRSCISSSYHQIPPTCFEIIRSIPGNNTCIDCGASNPDWATVSYGALICMICAGRHRSLGVNCSKVHR